MSSKPNFKPYEGDEKYIFVSYSHKDDEKVYGLIQQLHNRGYHIWYDAGIPAGADWNSFIAQHIKNAALVLLFMSPNAVASEPVNDEIALAKKYRKQTIPIFLYETEISDGLELQLGRIQWEFYYRYSDDDVFFDRLLASPLFWDLSINSKSVTTPDIIKPVIHQRGNTPGNLANQGLAAIQGDWIYYSGGFWDEEVGLCKIHIDGSGRTKLCGDSCTHINVMGDWIYYCNWKDTGSIYRIKIDGSEKEILIDYMVDSMSVIGDWMYYYDIDDHFYKTRIDGSEKIMLNDGKMENIYIVDDWIYYINFSDNVCRLYVDGSSKEDITNEKCSCMIVEDEWVFYRNEADGGTLYKIRSDGTDRQKLNDDMSLSWDINIDGEWIYYCNRGDCRNIYRMRKNGSSTTKLNDDNSKDINIVDKWIYYINEKGDVSNTTYELHKMRLDGSENQPVD